jgi:hypothetical protein
MAEKILLWIEDNPTKDHYELIQKTARKKGIELKHVSGAAALRSVLEDLEDNSEKIIIQGIILDLMIYGTNNLADFGYPEVSWADAANAGEYLLKYVFRKTDPRQKGLEKLKLSEKPVLILTVKSETRQEDFMEYGKKIELNHKYDLDSADLNKRIRDWINAI